MIRNRQNRTATRLLKAFLAHDGVLFVPDEQQTRSIMRPGLPFDVVAFPVHGAPLALSVRSSKIKGNEKQSSTTHTYVARKKLNAIDQWLKRQSIRFEPYIVFVMETTRPEGPAPYHFDGKDYQLVAAPVLAYIANMEHRAASSWDKVQVSSAVFESIAVPLVSLLQRGRAGAA